MANLKTWYMILNGTYGMHTEPVQSLDSISRWLIATRSLVFVMTVNVAIVAALLYVLRAGFGLGLLLPLLLVVLGLVLALPRANLLFHSLSQPKLKEPPAGAITWPIWYLGFVFNHNRRFGSLYVLGLPLSVLLRIYIRT